jgi:molybdopterin-guanine dinucleotide biosynthesis protein A
MAVTIAILAGGESRRMGQDKADIVVAGETLLRRTVRLAREVCPRVMVVGRVTPADSPFPDVPFYPDAIMGKGPVGGLVTALSHAESNAVLLVACDLPRLTTDALRWALGAADELAPLTHGLVTVVDGQREPVFSVYVTACVPIIDAQLAAGRRSLMAIINAGQFAFADAPPEVAAALGDIDTPEDWDALG